MKEKLCFALVLLLLMITGCGSQEAATPAGETPTVEVTADEASTDDSVEEEVEEIVEEPESTQKGSNITVTDNRNKTTSNEENASSGSDQNVAANVTVTDEDFDVSEYLLETKFGSSYYSRYYLIITSNAEVPVKINGNATAYDAGGAAIGAGNMNIEILGPGETSIGYFFFDGVSGIDKVDYQLTYSTKTNYYPCLGDIAIQQTLNDKNVTVTLTNNGTIAAEFVEAHALFFDADHNLVKADSDYITDGEYQIKPGATMSGQLDIYDGNYDHVEIYLTGRASGKSSPTISKATVNVTDEDFDITEYLYENNYAAMYFIIVTNNSSEIVSIKGNATALDSNGNSIGAADTTINVLGPNETTAAYFYFKNVKNVDSVTYTLSYNGVKSYKPVINNLSVEATVNDKNVVVAITNNGDYAAQFVEARAIFFDVDNNVVYQNSEYVVDGDHEIKPAATISKQIKCTKAFDHVEIYLDGRGK